MPRDLEADRAMLATVLDHAQKRDIRRAAAIAERALTEGFEHPLLLNVLATRLEQEGRLEEAVRLLERAVEIAPGDVPARNALALGLQRVDRPTEALHHAEILLKAHPELGFAHASKGNALIALGSLAAARASHRRALELDPGNLAAMASLASIATHLGEHAEARRWAERLLASVPGFPDAVLSLAAAELAEGKVESAEARLRALIADRRAGPGDRARAYGALGDVLDAAARYDEAFAAYDSGNGLSRDIHRRFARGTSILDYTRALTTALGEFTPPPPIEVRERDAGPAAQHVMLMGFPRSGTTLLEAVLDGHPRVVSLEEQELLTDGVMRYMREPLDLAPLARAPESELAALRGAYWERVRSAGIEVAGKVFVDKYPLNTLKLPLIARLFPRAKILFARRDPRDVVQSCFRRRFQMNPAMYQLLTVQGAAEFYDAVMEFAARVRPRVALEWQEVRYERLVEDFDAELHRLCAFIGLEWTAGMEGFAERASTRERATPSTAQLSRGLERTSIGHWRHYASALEPVRSVLNPWVERLGYVA